MVYFSALVPLSHSKAAGSHEECLSKVLLADPLWSTYCGKRGGFSGSREGQREDCVVGAAQALHIAKAEVGAVLCEVSVSAPGVVPAGIRA